MIYRCTRCGARKPESEFGQRKRVKPTSKPVHPWCKECSNEYDRLVRRNPEALAKRRAEREEKSRIKRLQGPKPRPKPAQPLQGPAAAKLPAAPVAASAPVLRPASGSGTCQWLTGEPRLRQFCAEPCREGSPYCAAHHARCYQQRVAE